MRTAAVDELLEKLEAEINKIEDFEERVEVINHVRKAVSQASPFRDEPVDCVYWVKADTVHANSYNPNVVAGPEMRLLHESIALDGYTQPIVSCPIRDAGENGGERYEVVDGFHRNRVGKEYPDVKKRLHGYLPVSMLEKTKEERMAATIRHNRARGTHGIRPMSDLVKELSAFGLGDGEICRQLGMELDEVLRLKQITGLKEAFQNHQFSKSWAEFEAKYYGEEEKK